ncbi:MAG: HNH endonuclease [Polyangiaceae bacterium]|nr:HNH endonuclease [Polyangiaceae bacterium]
MTDRRREAARERYGWRCAYCGVHEEFAGATLTVDHHQPRSRGGSDDEDNPPTPSGPTARAEPRGGLASGASLPTTSDPARSWAAVYTSSIKQPGRGFRE